MNSHQTRRTFLQSIGGTVAAFSFSNAFASNQEMIKKDTKKIGFALLGLGRYAEYNLAVGLEKASNCYLAGIITGTPEKAEKWAKKYNLSPKSIYNYQNFDEIAHNKDIDVVYVVTPNSLHKDFVIRAAKAGKHVMCEKPMSISVKDAEEMITACRDAGVQLGIGYRLHFEPFNKELMRIGHQKVLGDVKFIEADFAWNAQTSDPNMWRLKKSMAGGGSMMDVGIYCIQAARYITGEEPLALTAQFGKAPDDIHFREVEDSMSWQMFFPSGVVFNGFTSYSTNIEKLYVSASKGWLEMSPAFSYGPLKGRTNEGVMNLPIVHHQQIMLEEISKELLANGKFPSHITGDEGLRDMKILMATYEAANTGKKIIL